MAETSEHTDFGIIDERGRMVGALTFRRSVAGGHGLFVQVLSARNGTSYGAWQREVWCMDADEAAAEIERRIKSMRARYARKYGKTVPK